MGEVNEVPIEGADLGNSPSEIVLRGQDYFRDKVVVHRTTSGVTGASDALEKADEVLRQREDALQVGGLSFITASSCSGLALWFAFVQDAGE